MEENERVESAGCSRTVSDPSMDNTNQEQDALTQFGKDFQKGPPSCNYCCSSPRSLTSARVWLRENRSTLQARLEWQNRVPHCAQDASPPPALPAAACPTSGDHNVQRFVLSSSRASLRGRELLHLSACVHLECTCPCFSISIKTNNSLE